MLPAEHAREQKRCRSESRCQIQAASTLCYSSDGKRHLQDRWHICCQGHLVGLFRYMPCPAAYRLYHSAVAGWDVWC